MKLYLSDDFPRPLKEHSAQHRLAYIMLDRLLEDPEWNCREPYRIAADAKGKPFLEVCPDLFFNLSHCPVCIAAVISRKRVGIDVQQRFAWKSRLAERICTEEEMAYLTEGPDEAARAERLNRIWCRKESFLKCIGTGLTKDLKNISVLGQNGLLQNKEGTFRFTEMQNEKYTLCICEESHVAF